MTRTNNLEDRVYEAMGKCLMAGFNPTDLWLGMAEMRELEEIMMDPLQSGPCDFTAEKLTYQGLNVRLMQESGVRVGVSHEG